MNNKLKTQKKLPLERPIAHWSEQIPKLENVIEKNCEIDSLNDWENLLS